MKQQGEQKLKNVSVSDFYEYLYPRNNISDDSKWTTD